MTWQSKTHCEILEVEQSATIEEIEQAKKLQITAWLKQYAAMLYI